MEKPLSEITLRKYETPYQLGKRELAKRICLSLGLLQPGDSRDVIADILLVLMNAKKEKKYLEIEKIQEEVIKSRKEANCEEKGIAESNIRRQLRRLKDLMVVERKNNSYRISEFSPLSLIFEEKIERFLMPSIISRIKEYLKEFEKE